MKWGEIRAKVTERMLSEVKAQANQQNRRMGPRGERGFRWDTPSPTELHIENGTIDVEALANEALVVAREGLRGLIDGYRDQAVDGQVKAKAWQTDYLRLRSAAEMGLKEYQTALAAAPANSVEAAVYSGVITMLQTMIDSRSTGEALSQ